ncbi:transketolase, partial [Bacillus licheniformis]
DQKVPVDERGSSHASHASSGEELNGIAQQAPVVFGGSAALDGYKKTTIKDGGDVSAKEYAGRNIWFGVSGFAMGAALNGMAL